MIIITFEESQQKRSYLLELAQTCSYLFELANL